MINHLKSFRPLWEVHSTDVNAALELALGVVTEEGQNRDNTRGCGVERQFVP